MANQLTQGTIEKIMTGETVDKPTLQVLGHKKIAGGGGNAADRYRLLLSDGVHSLSSAMLATQLNDKVDNNEVESLTIIRLDKYICNLIQPDRRVVIVLDLTVVTPGSQVGQRLGNPQAFKPGQSNNNAAPAKPQVNGGMANKNNSPPQAKPAPQQGGGFYGNQQNGSNAPKQSYSVQSVPTQGAGTPSKVHPISSLTPYQNRWTIKARVTQKSDVRTWNNSRGEGKLFSMTLIDESGEIKATCFREQVDKYFDMVEEGKVYFVRKASLKTANKQYNNTKSDYEMTFNNDSEMIPCEDQTGLPVANFEFIPIGELERKEPNTTADVLGVVQTYEELSKVISKKTGSEITKRDLQLVDEGKVQIKLTLWGKTAENFDGSGNPVIAVKGARVSDFGGRSLSAMGSSQVMINPDLEQSHRLRGWYDSEGRNAEYQGLSVAGGAGGGGHATNWKSFLSVKDEKLGQSEKPDYFTVKGTVVFMKKENCMYQACPKDDCNKKVIDQSNGYYRCEKCNAEFPNFKWRMILQCNLADHSDNQWVTCFQDTAEIVLGNKADEIGRLKENDEASFDQLFSDANFKSYIFKCRAKMEMYNDESRLKTIVVQATPLNYQEYNKKLISDIERMLSL